MLIKNKIIPLIIIFFICAHFSFAQTPLDNSSHRHEDHQGESGQLPGKHEHHDEDKGEHISGEHEKLELFHAEYYGMPWRSPQTQRDLWIIMGFLLFVNLGLLLIIRNKLKRKYGQGKR